MEAIIYVGCHTAVACASGLIRNQVLAMADRFPGEDLELADVEVMQVLPPPPPPMPEGDERIVVCTIAVLPDTAALADGVYSVQADLLRPDGTSVHQGALCSILYVAPAY